MERKENERKEIEWIFIFHKFVWMKRKIRGNEIEKEVYSLICLYRKVRGKKKIMMSNNNFTFMSF